jgi:hypothetical protein
MPDANDGFAATPPANMSPAIPSSIPAANTPPVYLEPTTTVKPISSGSTPFSDDDVPF